MCGLLMQLVVLQDCVTYGHCPERCICKWKGGKETVECVNVTLSRYSKQVLNMYANIFQPILYNL